MLKNPNFSSKGISIQPVHISFHVPPGSWKGDPKGHIGKYDTFFYVIEGEIILFVDSKYFCVKSGQLAFLPKGKLRKYTQVSDKFVMYEARFEAEIDDENLMETLGVTENNFVVSIADNKRLTELFITAHREELNKDPIFHLTCSANLLEIIKIYTETARANYSYTHKDIVIYEKLIGYMQDNLDKSITLGELENIAHIEGTYLIRKFKKAFGIPPMAYFGNMKYHKAVELLLNSDLPIEAIGASIGIQDGAYFSRWFRKSSNMSPSEFRRLFNK